MIPDFSVAISGRVFPRSSKWSNPERGKPGSDGRRNTVCRVESAADPDLEHHDVEAGFHENLQAQKRQELEISRHAHPLVRRGFQLAQRSSKAVMKTRLSTGLPLTRIRSRTSHRCGDVKRPVE